MQEKVRESVSAYLSSVSSTNHNGRGDKKGKLEHRGARHSGRRMPELLCCYRQVQPKLVGIRQSPFLGKCDRKVSVFIYFKLSYFFHFPCICCRLDLFGLTNTRYLRCVLEWAKPALYSIKGRQCVIRKQHERKIIVKVLFLVFVYIMSRMRDTT